MKKYDLFSERKDVSPFRKSSKKDYSTFIDARDLEWARGSGLRCSRKRERKSDA